MHNLIKQKNLIKMRRHRRVRSKILGTPERPRLSVYRSNRHIFLQLIDDLAGRTLASVSDMEINEKKGTKTDLSHQAGKLIAQKAIAQKIVKVVFDRGGYKYHGRIKAVADGAREGGLIF